MNIIFNIKAFFAFLLELIYPSYCSFCKNFLNNQQDVFCNNCVQKIQPVVSYSMKITSTYSVIVFSIGAYTYPLKQLILAKHNRDKLSAQDLGHLLWNKSDLKYASFDYIVPLPLHWSRYAFRWYNQSEEMAKIIQKYSGKPLLNILKKNKKTVSQSNLCKEKRMQNVKNAFSVDCTEKKYQNSIIVLIDDVMTTGATITAAVNALRKLNPSKIIVAVGCRVI